LGYPLVDMTAAKAPNRKLAIALAIVFVVALLMGPGPGVELVNPDPGAPGPPPTFLGLPIVYAWGLLWFAVQVGVLVVAYLKVWSREEADD